MPDLIRTPEWDRLCQAGLFEVEDRPGSIMLHHRSRYIRRQWRRLLMPLAAGIFGLYLGSHLGLIGTLFVPTLYAVPFLIPIAKDAWDRRYINDGVFFLPDRIMFFRGDKCVGGLPREGMQQIALKEWGDSQKYSHFVSDVGFMSAFLEDNGTGVILRNNMLLVAYRQPLHLDTEARTVTLSRRDYAA